MHPMAQTDKQTDRHTDITPIETESAQLVDSVEMQALFQSK